MDTIDLRFYDQKPGFSRTYVGNDIYIAIWHNGDIGFEHYCPGVWQDNNEPEVRFLICPLWPGKIVSYEPLTLRPSLLCNGAANPCGLHGFVTNGLWIPC